MSSDDVVTDLQPAADVSDLRTRSFAIVVVEGPDAGLEFVLDANRPSRVLVGQSPVCELRLSDSAVSRRHAALELVEAGIRLSDLGSTNGTFVNGLSIVELYLRGGELVRIGNTVLRVEGLASESHTSLVSATRFGRVIGASVAMRKLYPLCERIAQSNVPTVIEGETGTGKELLAEAIHEAGPRRAEPFVIFDCTTVHPNLMESELFGHERGAFTGATNPRAGVFEQAHQGSLFIDEIGDLDLTLQPKLLRAIERGEVRRIGAARWIPVDVRVIAATRRDLDREVQQARFRDDLYFRLAVARIELPPLRNRRGDIALLANSFWRELGGREGALPYDVLLRWEDYAWPGNVRELYNAVARVLALGEFDRPGSVNPEPEASPVSGAGDFIDRVIGQNLPLPRARERVVSELERRYVERVVEAHGGNVSRAARASGIGHRYFQKLRAKLKSP